MKIEGKVITVPEQSFNFYWIVDLRVGALDPTVGPKLRAVLRPYRLADDGTTVIFSQGLDKVLTIDDLDALSAADPGAAAAVDGVLRAVEAVAKAQGLI